MLRYQFGPFFAYFNTNRTEDLVELAEYALKITPNSEEALLWRGWGLYRSGDKLKAAEDFLAALEAHPGYFDAEYALEFTGRIHSEVRALPTYASLCALFCGLITPMDPWKNE